MNTSIKWGMQRGVLMSRTVRCTGCAVLEGVVEPVDGPKENANNSEILPLLLTVREVGRRDLIRRWGESVGVHPTSLRAATLTSANWPGCSTM